MELKRCPKCGSSVETGETVDGKKVSFCTDCDWIHWTAETIDVPENHPSSFDLFCDTCKISFPRSSLMEKHSCLRMAVWNESVPVVCVCRDCGWIESAEIEMDAGRLGRKHEDENKGHTTETISTSSVSVDDVSHMIDSN